MTPSGPEGYDPIFYFAYGSNLCVRRLGRRAPRVITLGVASLEGFALRWHKRGADGSGMCTIIPSSAGSAVVHGALPLIPKESMVRLDEVEGVGAGYEKASVPVPRSVRDGGCPHLCRLPVPRGPGSSTVPVVSRPGSVGGRRPGPPSALRGPASEGRDLGGRRPETGPAESRFSPLPARPAETLRHETHGWGRPH